jgi:hypothetical protein
MTSARSAGHINPAFPVIGGHANQVDTAPAGELAMGYHAPGSLPRHPIRGNIIGREPRVPLLLVQRTYMWQPYSISRCALLNAPAGSFPKTSTS